MSVEPKAIPDIPNSFNVLNSGGVKMICEAFNKMGQFVDYVFDDNWSYKDEIKLWELALMIIIFSLTLFVISWWLVPTRFLFKKCDKITFYYKKKKGE